jgi:hypothetical protein
MDVSLQKKLKQVTGCGCASLRVALAAPASWCQQPLALDAAR